MATPSRESPWRLNGWLKSEQGATIRYVLSSIA
jgi:hypothetical protein